MKRSMCDEVKQGNGKSARLMHCDDEDALPRLPIECVARVFGFTRHKDRFPFPLFLWLYEDPEWAINEAILIDDIETMAHAKRMGIRPGKMSHKRRLRGLSSFIMKNPGFRFDESWLWNTLESDNTEGFWMVLSHMSPEALSAKPFVKEIMKMRWPESWDITSKRKKHLRSVTGFLLERDHHGFIEGLSCLESSFERKTDAYYTTHGYLPSTESLTETVSGVLFRTLNPKEFCGKFVFRILEASACDLRKRAFLWRRFQESQQISFVEKLIVALNRGTPEERGRIKALLEWVAEFHPKRVVEAVQEIPFRIRPVPRPVSDYDVYDPPAF